MKSDKTLKFIRHWLLLIGAACFWFLWDSRYTRNLWFKAVAAALLVCVILFFLTWKTSLDQLRKLPAPKTTKWVWAAFIAGAVALVILFFNLKFHLLAYGSGRFALVVGFSGVFALLLSRDGRVSPYLTFAQCLLVFGVLYRAAAFLPEIQTGPFSLGWSEGSRFYNASLFTSEKIYGTKLPLPVLHPSRYLMQALPFFVGIRSILFHRAWQVALWLGMTLWGSWLLAKRLLPSGKTSAAWLTALLFLFFFQGAVYYHLMVCVVLVLLGYKRGKPLRTLLFVLLASAWAGISRVNWMPVPGVLAVGQYLLDESFDGKRWLKYMLWPVIWVVGGLAVAFVSKQGYSAISGEDPALFDSAFSSALLWRRLLPNATFFLGILPAIILVTLPGVGLLWQKFRQKALPAMHWLRRLGLAGILGVFFAGGLVVSVKIGGGGDLHNMDAFLVLWAVIVGGVLAMADKSAQTSEESASAPNRRFWLAMAVIIPVFFAFQRAGSWSFGSARAQGTELDELKKAVAVLQENGGEVLFISERQLLTFGELDLKVVPEYEKVFLMEMAMGNNQDYLRGFQHKLEEHAFTAIISDALSANIQGSERGFADENNAWVRQVVLPMLAQYQGVLSWRNGEINLLVPQSETELIQQLLDSQQPVN